MIWQNNRQAIKTSRTGSTLQRQTRKQCECSPKSLGAKLEALYFELVQGCILSSMVQTAGGHSRLQPIKQIKYETQDAKIKVNYEKKWMKQIVQTEFRHCISSVEPHSVVVTSSKLFYGYFA